jgi:serine/threonine-protein kinase
VAGDRTEPDEASELDPEDSLTQVESPAALRRTSGEIPLPAPPTGTEDGSVTVAASLPAGARSLPASEIGSAPSMAGSRVITTTSPVEALKLEEIDRTRNFLYIVYAFCIVVPSSLPLLGGSTTLKWVLVGAVAVCLLLTARLHVLLRDPNNYTQGRITFVAFACAFTAYIGVFFWGVFSVAPSIIVMGVYFFSRSESLRSAFAIYLTCAALQASLTGLILIGAFEDPGLFPIGDHPVHELVITQAIVQVIFLATFFVARSTRKTTLDVIEKLQLAMAQVAQREALFQEVRQELDQALRIEGAGRYTDKELGGFRLGRVLGRGAMGEVYEAFHVDTDEPAAIKVLHPNVLENPAHVTRFFREAEAASALESPHVVRVLSVSDTMEIMPFMVMERLQGEDLAQILRNKRRLGVKQTVKLLREVGSVIDAARAKRIVHRDLKPQNLLLAKQDSGKPMWKILDFGVSKLGEHSGTLTQGHVVGTPVYMAPEQARGETVDGSADLYALGAVTYRCLTGRPPFSGKDVPSILYNVVYDMPPRPSELTSLPADVDAVLAIALAKRPRDRFESAGEMASALQLAAASRLDERTRNRARALLSSHPWGKVV